MKKLWFRSAILAGVFVFLEKHAREKNQCLSMSLAPAFVAGASVFCEEHNLEKAVVFGPTFLAGAFVFWTKKKVDLKKPWFSVSAFLPGAPVF